MYLLFDTLISSSSSSLEVEQDEKKQLATPPTPAIRAAATGRIGTLRNAMSQSVEPYDDGRVVVSILIVSCPPNLTSTAGD